MNQNKNNRYTLKIVTTGLLIAMALIIRNFSYMIYLGGAPAMRISFSGPFTKLPGILFGPLFGGISGGLVDILGFLMHPVGGYIPWLTVTAILGGVLTAILWNSLKVISTQRLQWSLFTIFVLVGLIGLLNHVNDVFFPNGSWGQLIQSIGKKSDYATYGLEVASLIGIGLFILDRLIEKKLKDSRIHEYFLKLLISVGVSGLIVTTFNTYILQIFIPSLSDNAFLLLWIPRAIQELFMSIVQAYIISLLLQIYKMIYPSRDL